MNPVLRRWLNAGAWIGLFFAVLAALTLVVGHFVASPFAESLKSSVEATLRLADANSPLPGDPVNLGSMADTSDHAWVALRNGKPSGYVFLVRVTGTAGPWPAVFSYDTDGEVTYVGIVGQTDGLSSPVRYGLTARIIESWTTRLGSIVDRLEALP